MKELKEFVELSRYAGERFDLVQAAGGNSSVKLDNGEMLIKASGFILSEVGENSGYARVYTTTTKQIVSNENILCSTHKKEREFLVASLVEEATIDKKNRPSIETLLHALLMKYTLHTHPVAVNMITIQKKWREILKNIFDEDFVIMVDYHTPGIELAIALHKEIQACGAIPNIVFLQNHGLIVTADSNDEVKKITEEVLLKIEQYLDINMSKYKLTNTISGLFNALGNEHVLTYLCEDAFLNRLLVTHKNLFFCTPFFPDRLVYCGVCCVELSNASDLQAIQLHIKKYHELPRVLMYKGNLFLVATSLKKAKEIEEVLKLDMMVLFQTKSEENNFLSTEELDYLNTWEAEKYRQKK